MKCPKCGKENAGNVKFCGFCGAEISVNKVKVKENKKKKHKKRRWILLVILILLAAGMIVVRQKREKEFRKNLETADKYLEEMDYEKAEEFYLAAISVEPKEKEPYLKLTELYLISGEKEKAQDILAEAKENLPEQEWEELEQFEETTESLEDYTWEAEPVVEAGEIYYLKENDFYEYPENEAERQMFTTYAVMENAGEYGLIDMSGNLLEGIMYEKIETLAGYYMMTRKTPIYVSEYRMDMTDFYLNDFGEVQPAVAVVGSISGIKGEFYFCDGLHNVAETYGEDMIGPATWSIPKEGIPVKQSDELFDISRGGSMSNWREWYANLESLYGIYKETAMTTDFIYENCGSECSGLLAAKKDGKWGYVRAGNGSVLFRRCKRSGYCLSK